MNKRAFLWMVWLLVVTACQPQIEPVASGAPRIGKIIPYGEPIRVELEQTIEKVPNCSGSVSTLSKHPDTTILTSHSVEWEVGGEAGVGVTIGEGVIPFGVDLSGALTGSTGESIVQEFSQSSSWTLPAAPGEIIEYTLAWWELWQPGYIDVTLVDQSVIRINVKYRSGIQSDITAQVAYDCDGQLITVTRKSNTNTPTLPATSSPEVISSPEAVTSIAPPNITQPVETKIATPFTDWEVPTAHVNHTEYRRCSHYPEDNFPEFSPSYPGYIFLNPGTAQLKDGAFNWCFQVRTVLDTTTLETQFYPDYSSAGYGALESIAVYFCVLPATGFCEGKVFMPAGSAVVVDDFCILSPVVGNRNGVSTKQERSIRVTLPANTTESPTIVVGPYPVGNPSYIACP